jgi:uncharacterized repeat protein (TIGR01451 family)
MAADLVVAFNDNIAANVDRTFYSPASQVVYTLTLENKGDATATDAALTTSLASGITQKIWTAAFTGGASGTAVGAGDLNTKVTLPANGKAVFTIVANVGSAATGDLVSSATVAAASGETNTANNTATDTDRFVPGSIAVADDTGWSSTSLVRLVNPSTGAMIAQAFAFEPNFRTGVRTALGDLNGDGKAELVAVPNYGRVGQLAVFQQNVASDGTVTLAGFMVAACAAVPIVNLLTPLFGAVLMVHVQEKTPQKLHQVSAAVAKPIGTPLHAVFLKPFPFRRRWT